MTFANQHRRMLNFADRIAALVARTQDGDLDALPELRLQFSREINSHVTEEVALFQSQTAGQNMTGSPRADLITRYHNELLNWRRELLILNVNWPAARIAADRQGFLAAFKPLRDALEKRIRWEEEVFYPGVLSLDLLGHRAG